MARQGEPVMDRLTPERRSWLMSRIRSGDTKPERAVRSLLHAMGFRFRLHRRDLPGTPDIVLSKYRTVVFVHGCFWHGHFCKRSKMPRSRVQYWSSKIEANKRRDTRVRRRLVKLGWNVVVVREWFVSGELKNPAALRSRLHRLLVKE